MIINGAASIQRQVTNTEIKFFQAVRQVLFFKSFNPLPRYLMNKRKCFLSNVSNIYNKITVIGAIYRFTIFH